VVVLVLTLHTKLTYMHVCMLHKKLRISECPQKISVIVTHIIDPTMFGIRRKQFT